MKAVTREEYESALHTIRMYALQCNHLVSTIDTIIGANKAEEVVKEKPKRPTISDCKLETRVLKAILNYNEHKIDEDSVVDEIANISKKALLKYRGVGIDTINEIFALADFHGIKLKP